MSSVPRTEPNGRRAGSAAMPSRSAWLARGFLRYARGYVARHVHAVRVLRGAEPPEPDAGRPLVVVMNHPSWWDPLAVAVAAQHYFPERAHYGPIDRAMLTRYPLFGRLGFFGVETGSARGARTFLRTAGAVARTPGTALWVTAEGAFRDVRARPVSLRRGVGHVAARLENATVVPMAIELTYWDERTPEMLMAFGPAAEVPWIVDGRAAEPDAWVARLAAELESTLDRLATASQARDSAAFHTILSGRAGIGGAYDAARRLKAWLGGRRFEPQHGSAS